MVKKVIFWVVVAFILFFIITNPKGAADVASSIGSGLADAARSFGTFFSRLVS